MLAFFSLVANLFFIFFRFFLISSWLFLGDVYIGVLKGILLFLMFFLTALFSMQFFSDLYKKYNCLQASSLLIIASVFCLLSWLLLFMGEKIYGESLWIAQEKKVYALDCSVVFSGEVYQLPAGCILQGELPQLEVKEILDLAWENVDGFYGGYQAHSAKFTYPWARPFFKDPLDSLLDRSVFSHQELIKLADQGEMVSFSKRELAHYLLLDLDFYVSEKDSSAMGNCTLRNYSLALEVMHNRVLAPGEALNVNRILAKNPNYCKGQNKENSLLFYGGVCGMTSQLFRSSLLHPSVVIHKRYPHGEWFTQYYGEEIWGDDASIYEMNKQLEIQNTGDTPIYFKSLWGEQKNFFAMISEKQDKYVEIEKKHPTPLSVELLRHMYEREIGPSPYLLEPLSPGKGTFLYSQNFPSRYLKKNYEIR